MDVDDAQLSSALDDSKYVLLRVFPFSTPIIPSRKPPVVRGARACTVCRTAKMKCVGADDGKRPCDRCKRQNLQCIFEKHRRGRKPGSKLSEASKMLRRLEKGLSTAKAKSQALESSHQYPASASSPDAGPSHHGPYASPPGAFPNNELPPLKLPPNYGDNSADPHYNGHSDDEEDDDPSSAPAKLISKENQRQPYFKTVLNSEDSPTLSYQHRSSAVPAGRPSPYPYVIPDPTLQPDIQDPISAGIVDEDNAKVLFDLIFLRLNPFINLFDPALHSVSYVRSRSPFLFTTLLMAGCKFFKPESFRQCQKMAHDLAVRAFAENWKSVEVVQAFACLCYWKEPEDTRTWTYIGYACRMAVELGLNRYHSVPPLHETELQLSERRNRERTYLVLFVHDRSLATQTGRAWMLPEDDLVRNAHVWHERGGGPIRPEDVVVSAFVQLRCITAETTEVFHMQRGSTEHGDLDRAVLLRNCNGKLTQWMGFWENEMQRAKGERFHMEFLKCFRLYVRVFLNSFGLQGSMSNQTRAPPSVQALSMCYTSAVEHLQIVYEEFAKMNMLRYGQDSITVMTAYCAVFLLRVSCRSIQLDF
ncbi:fungal-specific transcription factor domain-containing protein [Vararia minispora EC-137]|uniref:Fungal-specific transcription factor domain-containing protein n=1 Tax=Vararia minispora EC-137 TaxID=1314806 RepID=A0ACB8QCJ1_9AGAM|nr:fungal-specific transcription factor domain-containing protein [Vararia minispora EC-137]